MTQDVHGHEILERLIAAGGSLPLPELRRAASENYGAEARYFTCSAQGMSFDELLGFLAQRNKIAVNAGIVTVFAENVCGGGGEHAH